MRFWDSSALVPLCLNSTQTKYCLDLFKKDSHIIVWCLTLSEIWSALCRQARDQTISDDHLQTAKKRARKLSDSWSEVVIVEKARERSLRLMEVHGLKAADSLQLAAALIAADEQTRQFEFVSLDKRLISAAQKEGFVIHAGA